MSKFHINKKGIPAPCKAKKGKCPLGGAGEHFESQKAAEDFINSENESKYGLLPYGKRGGGGEGGPPKITNVEVSKESFEDIFPEAYNDHGYQVTGPHETTFEEPDSYNEEEEMHLEEIYNSLPKEFFSEIDGPDTWTLVPEYNFESHVSNHVMYAGHEDSPMLDDMTKAIEEENPYYAKNGKISSEIADDISKYAAERLKEEAKFSINGVKMNVFKYESADRNWAKEYINDGRLDAYERRNVKNVEVNDEQYSDVFVDSYNEHGYQVTGPHSTSFEEADDYGEDIKKSYDDIYKNLPKEFHEQVKSAKVWTMVPEKNLKSHIDNHIMYAGHQEDLTVYNKMTETVKELNPNAVKSKSGGYEIKPEVKEKISQYATDTLIRESKFSLNGNRMTIFKPKEDNIDWADEYIRYGGGYKEINSIE